MLPVVFCPGKRGQTAKNDLMRQAPDKDMVATLHAVHSFTVMFSLFSKFRAGGNKHPLKPVITRI